MTAIPSLVRRLVLVGTLALGAAASAAAESPAPPPATGPAAPPGLAPEAEARAEDAAEAEAEVLIARIAAPFTGDLDGILERGFLRVGTVLQPGMFSYDKDDQRGIVVDLTQELQKWLRAKLGRKATTLTIVLAPLPRDRLIPFLEQGRVDVLMANLTITEARRARVAFTGPLIRNIDEIVVTGPAAPPLASIDDLASVTVHVRASSSYHEHLAALNAARAAAGRPPIPVETIDENMQDNDILDLVAAGTLPVAIVDSHTGQLYAQIIGGLTVRRDLVLHQGGEIAWAVRRDSPDLLAALDGFVKTAAQGTLLGNMMIAKYFKDTRQVENAMRPEGEARFRETFDLIRKYAEKYRFDEILIAAQGYQESGLDQSKRSPVGAVGIMQVMPATARDPVVGIPDIHVADRNVEAGVKYLRFLRDRYFDDPAIDSFNKALFAFAAYNAGPGNIARARRRAAAMGLDPNVWFGSVELAAAKVVSREPVVYVRNILKYYVTYKIYRARLAERKG